MWLKLGVVFACGGRHVVKGATYVIGVPFWWKVSFISMLNCPTIGTLKQFI